MTTTKLQNRLTQKPTHSMPVQRVVSTRMEGLTPVQRGLRYAQSVLQRAPGPALAEGARAGTGQGLPAGLRTGIESMSGIDMSDVHVHYASSLPLSMNALAYAQGSDIHLAHGQEKHLPHEAWHIVQQRQGRVRTTTKVQGVNINDNPSLEREADHMGAHAMRQSSSSVIDTPIDRGGDRATDSPAIQRKVIMQSKSKWYSDYDPYTIFSTKAQATTYDKKLKAQGRERISSRVPTLYTYTHVKPTNKLSSVPQGPHVVAHRVTLTALQNTTDMDEAEDIFDGQVLAPDDVDEVMDDEAPSSGYSGQMQPRVDRFTTDYRSLYTSVEQELQKPAPDLITVKHGVNTLINMDPYATYGWKSTKAASKKHTKGKGESVVSPTFSQLTDAPSSSSISNSDAFDSFMQAREDLFNEHF